MIEMTFRDQWATCGSCGNRFVFRITEQRALAEQGRPVEPPTMCRRCRSDVRGRTPHSPGRGVPDRIHEHDPRSRNGNCRVYVGRLSYDTEEDALKRLFESVGTVRATDVIRDRHTGWSRGFAFVEMATHEAAQRAIATLNGAYLDGRQIKVAEARPRWSP
jgi:RNA recognition motif-containing protein